MRTTRTLLLCAFILWGYGKDLSAYQRGGYIPLTTPRYEAWGTYTSLAECESALKGWKMPQGYIRAVCLPDTVNPNGR